MKKITRAKLIHKFCTSAQVNFSRYEPSRHEEMLGDKTFSGQVTGGHWSTREFIYSRTPVRKVRELLHSDNLFPKIETKFHPFARVHV